MPRKRTQKIYFGEDQEKAVVRYLTSESEDERNKIFNEYLREPLIIMVESIIRRYKLYRKDMEFEEIHTDTMSFLITKINKFDPTANHKAYSYFGTIVKRWLILYNDKNYKKKITSTPVSTLKDDPIIGYTIEENNSPSDKLSHNDKIELFVDLYVDYCTTNIYTLFPKENDAKIADAILEIFRKREYFNNILDGKFNKKALYIHIREIIDVKTQIGRAHV